MSVRRERERERERDRARRQLEPRPDQRGKTKAKMAFTLSANDVTRLQLTHQQKKEQCDEISKKMPFLVLDVADKLQAGPHSTPPRGDFPDWCICTRCRPMETVQQHNCAIA
ncbi:hypothetical protein DPMN_003620 [Dreissena polymorpha]|uniref:Uncharacterized protein n=1 Tax=Dreissena polymorpha TaxID=45954 RepID=A0A9D4MQ17_DREPO|nr:hypothetical protein DPMN_003620 [Dreissena polymorpha]